MSALGRSGKEGQRIASDKNRNILLYIYYLIQLIHNYNVAVHDVYIHTYIVFTIIIG